MMRDDQVTITTSQGGYVVSARPATLRTVLWTCMHGDDDRRAISERDGAWRWVRERDVPERDGQGVWVSARHFDRARLDGLGLDVTERTAGPLDAVFAARCAGLRTTTLPVETTKSSKARKKKAA